MNSVTPAPPFFTSHIFLLARNPFDEQVSFQTPPCRGTICVARIRSIAGDLEWAEGLIRELQIASEVVLKNALSRGDAEVVKRLQEEIIHPDENQKSLQCLHAACLYFSS